MTTALRDNPQAHQAMDQFKMQASGEVGMSLKNDRGGDLGKAKTVKKMIGSAPSSPFLPKTALI